MRTDMIDLTGKTFGKLSIKQSYLHLKQNGLI